MADLEHTLCSILSRLLVTVFRCAGLATLALLIYFPVFKGMGLGLVPVALGLAGGAVAWRLADRAGGIERIRESTFVTLLIFLPVAIQVALIGGFRSQPTFDGLFVYREAVALVNTGRMSELTYYAPGQIWYYAVFFKLFGASYMVAQLAQVPLFGAMIWAGYRIARRVMPMAPARWAGIGIAVYPSSLLYVLVTPYYYYLYTLLILLMVWSWLAAAGDERRWAAAAGGAAAGVGALTKAVLLIAPVQALAFWILAAGRWMRGRLWGHAILFVVAMAVVIAPWAWRNANVFGEPVLICTSGGLVLYSANNPESDGLYSYLPDDVKIESPQEMLAHSRWCSEQALAFMRENPASFLRLVWLNLLHTWGTETTYVELINADGHSLGRLDPALRFLVQTGWGMLVLLWAAMAWRKLRAGAPATPVELIVSILVLSKWAVYSVYEGGARHHLPIVPILIIYLASELWSQRDTDPQSHPA